MFNKKEIYFGKKSERYHNVLSVLKSNGIQTYISPQNRHASDVYRGAAVGRFGEHHNEADEIVGIYVKNKDFETAKVLLEKTMY